MALITLQADPLIQWDTEVTNFYNQTQEAQTWVQDNILSTESVNTYETVQRPSGRTDLTRIKTQTYTTDTFTLVIDRTYPSPESCAGVVGTYTLTEN